LTNNAQLRPDPGPVLYPIEELRYAEPDECLADLQDVESILALLTRI
jgi:hypothetical protein